MLKKVLPLFKWLVAAIIFTFLAFYYFRDVNSHIFHFDEHHFIRKSYYFDLFFIKKDFKDARWYTQDAPDQPKIGPYIYGFALHVSGIGDIEQTLSKLNFRNFLVDGERWSEKYWARPLENYPQELIPILEPVWLGRRVSVIFSLATLIILFIFTTKVKGPLFGLLSTFFLGLNPLMYAYGRRAMTDSMQLFFFFAGLLLVLYFLRASENKDRSKMFLLSLALGVNLALAIGVKVSGILILLFLIIIFAILFFLKIHSKSASYIIISFLIIITSFSVLFVSLHPYLYKNPFRQFVSMYTNRAEVADEYRVAYPNSAIYNREKVVELITKRALLPEAEFSNFRLGKLPIDLWLFISGFLIMLLNAAKKLKRSKRMSAEAILVLWTLVVIISLIFYLKNNWPRYYLPTVAAVTVTQAYAISIFIRIILKRFSTGKFPRNLKSTSIWT